MQPTNQEQYVNVPRRSMDLEDYLDLMRRHKSWVFGPAFAGLVLAVVVAFLWPDTYVSSAVIRVVPPQVPQQLVPTNINSAMSQRINAMYQTISSRSNLTNIINTYNLYPRERSRKPIEDIIEKVRNKDIRISPVKSIGTREKDEMPAFQVSFAYENRHIAQKVTADLVSRFITENTRERTNQSVMTTEFLKDQVDGARQELDALTTRLAQFRQNFQGELPEQVAQNTMQLNLLEQRVSNLNAALARVQQEKLLLESDLRNVKTQRATLAPTPERVAAKQRNQRLEAMEAEILRQETSLAALQEQYKENHPDVRRLVSNIGILKKVRDKLAIQAEEEEEEATAATPTRLSDPLFEREARHLDAAMERIQAQLEAKALESDNYRKEIASTERQIQAVQARIHTAPTNLQQYADLLREEALAKIKFEELKKKQSVSTVATELERRQQGETLELLDAASLPMSPAEPNRLMIILAGAAMGLFAGIVFAGAREAKDSSLKNLKDVRAYTLLPILGSIPLLENDLVVRRRKRMAWLAWSTACLVGILIMTGSVVYYYSTRA